MNSATPVRPERKTRTGSKVFFGESGSGFKYEYEGDIPPVAQFEKDLSDDGSDGFEDVGQFRVHYNKADEKSKPKAIHNYLLGAKLGEGANAKVKEGIDVNTLRVVAVKIIERKHIMKLPDGLNGIKREIGIMKSMKKHPNVIELIEVIDYPEEPRIYVVMELANGCSLQDLMDLRADKRIPVEQVKFYFRQLLLGLRHLHGKNVVHRDIKPENLMLTTEHELKISDFGVAEFLDKYNESDHVTKTSGSPAFLPPEIANGEYNFSGMAVDVWAAGVTLYFLLVGKIPFEAEGMLELFKKIREGVYTVPDFVDEEARDLIRQMLNMNASERISVREVLKHPWLQEQSQHNVLEKFMPIETRDIQVIKALASLYGDEGKQPNSAEPSEGENGNADVENSTAQRFREFAGCSIM
ncbi:hypothetical protein NDN08_000501 [Rhodosorus marinus]|uniref:non-specific serine/threonine protein kinase n=1 Tax=Rhodosorus marinus TaxID=101924 RepID=A0AAV8UN39_9RHOD|nr:hypothetical protein NDN08_000501 [Rhodosorus marinus]